MRTSASKKPVADCPPELATEQVPAAVDATVDAITATMMKYLEQLEHLLPATNNHIHQQPAPSASSSTVETINDIDGPDTFTSDLLGGELSALPSTYNVVNRSLGAKPVRNPQE